MAAAAAAISPIASSGDGEGMLKKIPSIFHLLF